MGSDSDLEIMREAGKALDEFGIAYEIDVTSAHRSPDRTADYARNAAQRGIRVIIAGAGGAAHLAGVIAAHTTLPVIGVPIPSTSLQGMDSLLAVSYTHLNFEPVRERCRNNALPFALGPENRLKVVFLGNCDHVSRLYGEALSAVNC